MSSSTGGMWESEKESDSEEADSNNEGGDCLGDDENEEQSSVVSWHGEGPVMSGSGLGGESLRARFRAGPTAGELWWWRWWRW